MKRPFSFLTLLSLLAGLAGQARAATVNPPIVNLGTAGNYTILAQTGISTTPGTPPDTAVVGDIGVFTGADTTLTGFGQTPANATASTVFSTSPLVTGNLYAANYIAPTPSELNTAVNDMGTAYTDASSRNPGDAILELGTGTIGTPQGALARGVYRWSTGLNITSNLTLSGSATDRWIFVVAGNLLMSSSTSIILSGGALASNIVWVVAGTATLSPSSIFSGTILSQTLIAMQDGASLTGRALAQTAVTLIANSVSPSAVVVGSSTPSPTHSPTTIVTLTPTQTLTSSPTTIVTLTPTQTLTSSPTTIVTMTPTQTLTSSPTTIVTLTPTRTLTSSPTATVILTLTPTRTATAVVSSTSTRTPTASPTGGPSSGNPLPVDLGDADGFGVLATTFDNTNGGSNTGYIGATTQTGGSMSEGCVNQGDGTFTQSARVDLAAAFSDAENRALAASTDIPTVELGGLTLLPGIYSHTTLELSSGVLTLDGNNEAEPVFIFYSGSTLITAAGGSFSLINGAEARNVFWAVASSATLGSGSAFVGTILAQESITLVSGATIEGRLLAMNAVTTDNSTINTNTSTIVPCPGIGTATPTANGTFTTTPTAPGTFTVTRTRTVTRTLTSTRTTTPTPNGTFTVSPTRTSTRTTTPTPNGTFTVSPTRTVTRTPTRTPAVIGTLTNTPIATSVLTPMAPASGGSYIYPSPSRGDSATVVYQLKEAADVTLKFYNQTGRLVSTITEAKPAGQQASQVSVGKFSAGTYYYLLSLRYSSGASETQPARKFVVLH